MSVLDKLYEKARLNPQRVAFPEATNEKMMRSAYETGRDGYIVPVLVGNAEELKELAVQRGYDVSVFTIVDIHDEEYKNKVIEAYVNQPGRMLKAKALGRRMENPLYFAMVMQAVGEADVTFAGIDNTTGDVLLAGHRNYFEHFLKALNGEEEIIVKPAQVRRVLRVMEAVRESARTGKAIALEA